MNDWDIDLVEYISNLKKLHFAKAPGAFSSIHRFMHVFQSVTFKSDQTHHYENN